MSSSPTISRHFLLFLSPLLLLSLDIRKNASADPVLLNTYCPNATFALESSFLSNRDLLLSSLASNAEQQTNGGFYKTSVGSTGSGSAVYGLFLCRGDVDEETCQTSVTTAVDYTRKSCSGAKEAIVWYGECMILYSNESNFFQRMHDSVQVVGRYGYSVTGINITEFMQIVGYMFEKIASNASNGGSSKKFATLKANYTNSQAVYGVGQCIPDLSTSECYRCLQHSINVLLTKLSGQEGGGVFYPSCLVWYANFSFFYAPTPALLLPPPPPPPRTSSGKRTSRLKVIFAAVFTVAIATVLVITGTKLQGKLKSLPSFQKEEDNSDIIGTKSFQYDFCTLQVATNHFSYTSKVGQGGSGAVYKGVLPNGQEIAVKKLSRRSNQAAIDIEFKNEVNLVAQLQHKNLVRLMGFCLAGDEKLLVLEFVPNKSLDYFLFDPQRQGQLDWARRYKIIHGIARGMHYLHNDSQLRIVHRDLKASNILLDMDFNPKIADFGLARIFGVEQTHEKTQRVAGTFGYMAPEYLIWGQFSMKSDVYSFGVLVLEIVSGKKNTSFHQLHSAQDLLSYFWKSWRDGTALELMDSTLRDSQYSSAEVLICIQLGLLCVQKDVDKRPTMAMIVNMLNNNSLSSLPVPQQPPFFTDSIVELRSLEQRHILDTSSVNETSITEFSAR